MRTEEEMYALILNVAKNDPRIRGVILNGSRANPNAPKDSFQDFDIVYLVKELDRSFRPSSHAANAGNHALPHWQWPL